MKSDRGYIVAMYNHNKSVCVISLEMWELIENIDEYTPLYRTDNKKDAYKYMKELSSNIQMESTMVNKQEFIEKVCNWLKDNANDYIDWQDRDGWLLCKVNTDKLSNDFRKIMEVSIEE